jgi:hypothetical protein
VYVKVTQGTPWGETASLAEVTVSDPTAPSGFNITVTIATSYLATFARAYWTIAGPGLEDSYIESDFTLQNSVTISIDPSQFTHPPAGEAMVPTISRAYNPDSDGNVCSAMLVYRWLADGLNQASQLTGGIRDVTGVPSTVGKAQYRLVGQWNKFESSWYDGYPFPGGAKTEIYRHGKVTGLSGVGTCNLSADRQVVELWPSPSRTAGSSTMTYGCSATDTGIILTTGTSWVLPFGVAVIGTYPPTAVYGSGSCEIIEYSDLSSSAVTQIERGMGGTIAQAWPVNTPVQECNIYFTGKRMATLYSRGQANFTFNNPPAWEDAIRTYMIYRFRSFEQDQQAAQAEFERFRVMCESVKNSQQPLGPRRIQASWYGGASGVEVAGGGFGSVFGGVIIP